MQSSPRWDEAVGRNG